LSLSFGLISYGKVSAASLIKKETNDWKAVKDFEIAYFEEKMREKHFAAWVAETAEGDIIATAALSFYETAPKPWNLESKYVFISSI
jgi:hypothetical protein